VTSPSSTAGRQRVLLGLVEAVDLVEEEDRRLAGAWRRWAARSSTWRTSARRPHRAELLERRAGARGHDPRDRRLAEPGGP
jgi:hypothetical protein